jgi:hypothetical protein
LPPTKAPAKSVPPLMASIQTGPPSTGGQRCQIQSWHSSDSGEPVEPTARSADRSAAWAGCTSAFRQLAKNAAPAPKKVHRASPAKRQSVVQSGAAAGPPGLPSKTQIVVPASSPASCAFHMIQPVLLNQWKRSAVSTVGPRSLCSVPFRNSTRMPPWPCTMGLGSPVVPDE